MFRQEDHARRPGRGRREQLRLAALVALAGLTVLFAVLNLDEVEVNWIVASWSTPLIVVIAVCLLIGAAIGWIARRRR